MASRIRFFMTPTRLAEVFAEVATTTRLTVVCLTEDGPTGQLEIVPAARLAAFVARHGVSSIYVTAGDPPANVDDFDFREALDDVAFTLGRSDDESRTIGSSGAVATPGGGGTKLLQAIEKAIARRSRRGVKYAGGSEGSAIKPYYWDEDLEDWELRGYEKLRLDGGAAPKRPKSKNSSGARKKPNARKK